MLPYIRFRLHIVPTYTIAAILGVLAVLLYFSVLKRKKREVPDSEEILVWGLVGGLAGAKVLYLLLCLPELLDELPYLISETSAFLEKYFFSGLVFYGGLYGCLLAVMLYCRRHSLKLNSICQAIPAIPLFHSFGRIGCFCMGCCYGIPWRHGIAFEHSQIAPNGIPLVPVQLMESATELLIFKALLKFSSGKSSAVKNVGLYFVLYGISRFLLEFLRGDVFRGFLGGLSTSQWISILTFAFGMLLLLKRWREKRVE